jgi:hypothetical protein
MPDLGLRRTSKLMNSDVCPSLLLRAGCSERQPLWALGKGDAAIRIEYLWDEVAREYDMDIRCGYVLSDFQREQETHIYERICAEHSNVYVQ